jgi:hypothetical protein
VLAADIERWSAALARDSAVKLLLLGDIIYPEGMHPADNPAFARDSAIVQSQVNLVAGPSARRYGAIAWFLAGNHDWGHARDTAGVERLRNLEEFLDRRRGDGVRVWLRPEAGTPGPHVVDFANSRLLLYDTAWWMLARDEAMKQRMLRTTRDAVTSAGDRIVIAAAHHPFRSAASHGGLVPFWKTVGVRFLMARSGAVLQDLNSAPYRELRDGLLDAFSAGRRPLLLAAGHDHNLQVIRADSAPEPLYSLVSGSGSKVTRVGHIEGMMYRHAAPGYMRLVIQRGGRVDLFVVAAPDRAYLRCDEPPGEALVACVAEKAARFSTTWSVRLQ